MLPTLHHGVGLNQSRLDYQSIVNDNRNSNITNVNNIDTSESRLNKSRLLDYGSNLTGPGGNYSNEHLMLPNQQQSKGTNKYGSDYSHLPNIRHNE